MFSIDFHWFLYYFIFSPLCPKTIDWSEYFPDTSKREDGDEKEKKPNVEFADIGCGYGGLLGNLVFFKTCFCKILNDNRNISQVMYNVTIACCLAMYTATFRHKYNTNTNVKAPATFEKNWQLNWNIHNTSLVRKKKLFM